MERVAEIVGVGAGCREITMGFGVLSVGELEAKSEVDMVVESVGAESGGREIAEFGFTVLVDRGEGGVSSMQLGVYMLLGIIAGSAHRVLLTGFCTGGVVGGGVCIETVEVEVIGGVGEGSSGCW